MAETGLADITGSANAATGLTAPGCAAPVDARGRIHDHRAHLLPAVAPDCGRPLSGPTTTAAFMPRGDDLRESSQDVAHFFHRAVGRNPGGRVLVLPAGGHPNVSHAGWTKLSRVARHGLAGVLADGLLRDFREAALEFENEDDRFMKEIRAEERAC
ncbi:hypothetical protein ABZ890_01170 [Streptomyces sp. NPDC046984]|uniref:RraA family protein n=1 Tax=Streptomyces sp. NPDC046984 TaxID=3155138 RepID=UPI0033C756AF